MHLTDFSDYSLRVLIHLNQTRELATLSEMALALNISRNHLIKISNRLVKLGYVEAVRGRAGGLRIEKSAGKVRVGAIVQNTEERIHLAECFAKETSLCSLQKTCVLQHCLHEAFGAFIASLNQRTLDDITPGKAKYRAKPPTRGGIAPRGSRTESK